MKTIKHYNQNQQLAKIIPIFVQERISISTQPTKTKQRYFTNCQTAFYQIWMPKGTSPNISHLATSKEFSTLSREIITYLVIYLSFYFNIKILWWWSIYLFIYPSFFLSIGHSISLSMSIFIYFIICWISCVIYLYIFLLHFLILLSISLSTYLSISLYIYIYISVFLLWCHMIYTEIYDVIYDVWYDMNYAIIWLMVLCGMLRSGMVCYGLGYDVVRDVICNM